MEITINSTKCPTTQLLREEEVGGFSGCRRGRWVGSVVVRGGSVVRVGGGWVQLLSRGRGGWVQLL